SSTMQRPAAVTEKRSKRGSVRSGSQRRSAIRSRYLLHSFWWSSRSRSDRSRTAPSRGAGSRGSEISLPFQPRDDNYLLRPWLTPSNRSGSENEAKNGHGVVAPHSSPMKIIGV